MNYLRNNNIKPSEKNYGYLFLLTGIFCVVSSLFAWGRGWLFSINSLDLFLLPMSDLVVTAPLSLITSSGILKGRRWGFKLGLITAGVYIFGSVQVFITLYWQSTPYSYLWIFPAAFGFVFAISFISYTLFKK
jgi:hypothetical protein